MKRFDEKLHPPTWQSLEISRELYSGHSEYQSILVFENSELGRVLVLDAIVQTTEADEFIYHEMLTHVPILAHGKMSEVLVIGGGDGGAVKEVLKHAIGRVTMVELDRQVVEVCREHIPAISGMAFADPRTDLIIADGAAFVADTEQRFDLIIVDSPDPVGPARVLFEREFYENCRRCLRDAGILVTQNGVPFFQGEEVRETHRALRSLFPCTGFYVAPVPTYYGGHMAFGWGSQSLDLMRTGVDAIRDRYAASKIATRYYNPDVHVASFALPGYIRELMDR